MSEPTRDPGQHELERNNPDRVNYQRGRRIRTKDAKGRLRRRPARRRHK